MEDRVMQFQQEIGITFNDSTLLYTALVHSSYANERKMSKNKCNERLEFLGDAVLELVSSDFLFREYDQYPEGQLTKIRASLVCEPTLAICARDIHLGDYIMLSKGEDNTGGRHRDSILSDAFEAVIGAIYLDQGIEAAKTFIKKYLFTDVENKVLFFDAKTTLQEYIQGEGKGTLEYVLINEEGPDHQKQFTMEARVGDKVIGRGVGTSKKLAQQQAAYEAIKNYKR